MVLLDSVPLDAFLARAAGDPSLEGDLTCAVVVAEVERHGDRVSWKRVGVARYGGAPADFAAEVRWCDGVESMTFRLDEYQTFLGRCRQLERPWWT